MDYQGFIIRPPGEADSILLQVTLGCTHNRCAFCGAYQGKPFRVKETETVFADIDYAAANFPDNRRLFLMDGDALSLSMGRLVPIFERVASRLPRVSRIGAYANARGLSRKTPDELAELKAMGLTTLYMGLESGDDATLSRMNKGTVAADIVAQGRKAAAAGLKLSVTVIVGLGGRERWREHAVATGEALTAMAPHHAAALTLMLVPGTPLFDAERAGRFALPSPVEALEELYLMLEHTDLPRGLFLANHASNHLPLKVRLPSGKAGALAMIRQAIRGERPLTPESRRRL